jgi:RNA recognition motif-containing protein
MSNQSQTLIFTNLIFTNCPIPICDDILSKLLARQCKKHGDIEYCNVNGSKNTGFVKFKSIKDAIFVQKLMNNQILFKSIVKIGFVNNGKIKTCLSFENKVFKTKQRDRIGKILEELL